MIFKTLTAQEAYVALKTLGSIKRKEELYPEYFATSGEYGLEIIQDVLDEKNTPEINQVKGWTVK